MTQYVMCNNYKCNENNVLNLVNYCLNLTIKKWSVVTNEYHKRG
jgi:hypothetical protein